MSATRTMVREDTAIILNDDSVVSSFGFEKNLSTITAWVLILLLSYDKSTIIGRCAGRVRSYLDSQKIYRPRIEGGSEAVGLSRFLQALQTPGSNALNGKNHSILHYNSDI